MPIKSESQAYIAMFAMIIFLILLGNAFVWTIQNSLRRDIISINNPSMRIGKVELRKESLDQWNQRRLVSLLKRGN